MSFSKLIPPEITDYDTMDPKKRIVKDRQGISKAIKQRVNELLPAADKLVCMDDTEYLKRLDSLAHKCEELTLVVRSLLLGVPKKVCFIDNVGKKTTVVSESDNEVIIKTISVLPHRKSDSTYFYNELYGAIREYSRKHDIKRYKEDTVVVISHMSAQASMSRDYDNYETKALIDIIALFFLVGDNPACMRLYQESKCSEEPYTEIRIMTCEAFKKYIL